VFSDGPNRWFKYPVGISLVLFGLPNANILPHHPSIQQAGRPPTVSLFAWLISHQPAVLFSHNKSATSNQPAVLFSQNKPAPAISHQPNEQA
jgi:hypothetical protein